MSSAGCAKKTLEGLVIRSYEYSAVRRVVYRRRAIHTAVVPEYRILKLVCVKLQ